MSIPFTRIKKKTLTLAYIIFPEDTIKIINEIKYKKLHQCINKEDLRNYLKRDITLTGHTKNISCIIRLSNTLLASASIDLSIRIWDFHIGKCINILTFEKNISSVFVIKLNSKQILSGLDMKIKIWNFVTGICVRTLTGHRSNINCLAKLNKSQIVSGGCDCTIKIWDLTTGNCFKTIKTHSPKCILRFNRTQLVIGDINGCVKNWDSTTFQLLHNLDGHLKHVEFVVKINNTQIASGSLELIRIWDITTGTCLKKFDTKNLSNMFCLNKKQLAGIQCNYQYSLFRTYDLANGNEKIIGQFLPISVFRLGNTTMAFANEDFSIKICDILDFKEE